MKFSSVVTKLFLLGSAGLLCAGGLLAALPPQTGQPDAPSGSPSPPPGVSPGISGVWKSETTQNEYRVRIQGDTLTAEWVNLPAGLARQGAYVRTVCRRVGTKWIGTTRSRLSLPCTEVVGTNGHPTKWCSLITRTEIDTISPDRITGLAQAPHRLNCESCELVEAQWREFTWVPKL